MTRTDSDLEQLVDGLVDEILCQDYERGWVAEGIFVMAVDLREDPDVDLEQEYPKLASALNTAIDGQQAWIAEKLRKKALPDGFSQQASNDFASVVDLTDPILDHEWLMHPGDDFIEVLVRQFYPVICGSNSLQTVTQRTKTDRNAVRDGALILITATASGGPHVAPLLALVALYLIEENIDDVCEAYTPY